MVEITVNGQTVDFIVRVETGTLNRFMYTVAMLAPFVKRRPRLKSWTTPPGTAS